MRPAIRLNMIVKNEAPVIRRCLESVPAAERPRLEKNLRFYMEPAVKAG